MENLFAPGKKSLMRIISHPILIEDTCYNRTLGRKNMSSIREKYACVTSLKNEVKLLKMEENENYENMRNEVSSLFQECTDNCRMIDPFKKDLILESITTLDRNQKNRALKEIEKDEKISYKKELFILRKKYFSILKKIKKIQESDRYYRERRLTAKEKLKEQESKMQNLMYSLKGAILFKYWKNISHFLNEVVILQEKTIENLVEMEFCLLKSKYFFEIKNKKFKLLKMLLNFQGLRLKNALSRYLTTRDINRNS